MVKLQQYFEEIYKEFNSLRNTDVNDERALAIEMAERLYNNAALLKEELGSRKGDFKPIKPCLNCHKEGLAYEPEDYKSQVISCGLCGTTHKVKLYKNGRSEVRQIFK